VPVAVVVEHRLVRLRSTECEKDLDELLGRAPRIGPGKLHLREPGVAREVARRRYHGTLDPRQAERPDQVVHKLRSNTPLWATCAVFGLIALGAYIGLDASLSHSTQNTLAGYADLVKLAPRPAYVTITLP